MNIERNDVWSEPSFLGSRPLIAALWQRPAAAINRDVGGNHPTPFAVPLEPARPVSVRQMSPREVVRLALALNAAGLLTHREYELLTFQPELHPDYARTVGTLVGRPAEPDRPRDFIRLWERRLAFELRYNCADAHLIDRIRHILFVLHRLESGPKRLK